MKDFLKRIDIDEKADLLVQMLMDLALLLIVLGMIFRGNPYFFVLSLVLLLIHNVIRAFEQINRQIIFLLFNFTFFFFLLTRIFVTAFFRVDYEYVGLFELGFDRSIATNIVLFISLSLFSLTFIYQLVSEPSTQEGKGKVGSGLVYALMDRLRGRFPWLNTSKRDQARSANKTGGNKKGLFAFAETFSAEDFRLVLQKIALLVFIVTIFAHIFYLMKELEYIRSVGYRQSYILKDWQSPLYRLMDMIGRMSFSAYFVYLASLPKKSHVLVASVPFLAASFIQLLQGLRNPIALNLLIVVIYFVLRSKSRRLFKKATILYMLIGAVLVVLFIKVGDSRGTEKITITDSLFNSLFRFFYNQGVTARTIGNAQLFSEWIPYKLYSFGDIIDFLKFSVGGLFQSDLVRPVGQSVQVVQQTHQLAHILSFLQTPFEYLNQGLGTGSSFIAELFVDFSVPGIIIGSGFYGLIIHGFRSMFSSNNLLNRACMLIACRNFLFTPRASYSFFLTSFFEKAQIASLVLLMVSALLVTLFLRKRAGGRADKQA